MCIVVKVHQTALFGLLLLLWGCGPVLNPPRLTPDRLPVVDNVVLVTLDGVRWNEIFHGVEAERADAGLRCASLRTAHDLTPNLHHLFFEGGTVLGAPGMGANLEASGPLYVSLPAYVEIMHGTVSGCFGNGCEPEVRWSLASAIGGLDPARGAAVFSSWETIARALPKNAPYLVRNTGRQAGDTYSAYPGHDEYRPDQYTTREALNHLTRNKPRFLWVALGDTDEWAHRGDYAKYIQSLKYADDFVGTLCEKLDTMAEYRENTVVIVTTDHGREDSFQLHFGSDSAPVWLMARGGPIRRQGVTALSRTRHLRDIAPTVLSLYGYRTDPCDSCGSVLDELFGREQVAGVDRKRVAARVRTDLSQGGGTATNHDKPAIGIAVLRAPAQ